MIKGHINAVDRILQDIQNIENTIKEIPHGDIRNALEVEARIMKRVAERLKDNSEDLYDQILDFSMKVALQ